MRVRILTEALALGALWLTLSACASGQEAQGRQDLRFEQIQPHAWLIVHERPFESNALLVEMANGDLLLCDTPSTEEATRRLLGWIDEQFGDRSLVAVNGHFHPDCLAGNAALLEAGAEVWASDLTPSLLQGREEGFRSSLIALDQGEDINQEISQTRYTAPGRVFDHKTTQTLRFGDQKAILIWPGAGHAPDNVVTHIPSMGIVFAGCLCFSMERSGVGNVRDADLLAWPASVDRVAALGAETVIPGHGKPGGPELLEHTKAELRRHAANPD